MARFLIHVELAPCLEGMPPGSSRRHWPQRLTQLVMKSLKDTFEKPSFCFHYTVHASTGDGGGGVKAHIPLCLGCCLMPFKVAALKGPLR